MSEIEILALAFGAGCALGAIFYGGLWWTVWKGIPSSHPALWFFASLWLRLGIVLTGFYEVASSDWKRLLACLAGFVIARIVVTRLTRELGHAD
jgi:F1F0 ATPase subunit 2